MRDQFEALCVSNTISRGIFIRRKFVKEKIGSYFQVVVVSREMHENGRFGIHAIRRSLLERVF